MGIKNLTPRLAEWGKIKIGAKGKMKTSNQGKQFAQPQKLDHFIITTMERDAAWGGRSRRHAWPGSEP